MPAVLVVVMEENKSLYCEPSHKACMRTLVGDNCTMLDHTNLWVLFCRLRQRDTRICGISLKDNLCLEPRTSFGIWFLLL